jgi:hypothetical protein
MSAAASDDPYDTGHVWCVDDFAARWRVDAGELRRALNLCAFSMRLTIGDESAGQRRKDLGLIAETGEAFALALAAAGDTSIFSLMAGLVPRRLRNDLRVNPGRHRQIVVGQVQKLADQAKQSAGMLKVTQKPKSGAPTRDERSVVTAFALLWHRTHGEWPNVTPHKGRKIADRRAANAAGRFTIAGAEEFFAITLSDQRLRTVLGSLQAPSRDIAAGKPISR